MSDLSPRLWSETCEELVQSKVGKDVVDRWLRDGRILRVEPSHVAVELPTSIHVNWVDTYYRDDLTKVFSSLLGRELTVSLTASDRAPDDSEEIEDEHVALTDAEIAEMRRSGGTTSTARVRDAGLRPDYTFDSFVVGDNSQFCQATAMAVSEDPGGRYNPVLFHGRSGLGKTHLMSAIGHEVMRRHKKKRVLFVSSEQFTNDFIEALKAGKLSEFRANYRKLDVLLIDDINFFAGKDSTQEEFYHTFNTLINHNAQIVMTSDRPPSEIQRLEKRLVSRFQWGMTAELLPPGLETRIAILRQKLQDWGGKTEVGADVIEFLAVKIRQNVRCLEGALRRVSSYNSLHPANPMTVTQAGDFLRDLLAQELTSSQVGLSEIQQAVAQHFDVRVADLSGRSRTAQIVMPRQVAMFLSRTLTNASLKEVGHVFGGRDHGTVIHAMKKVEEEMARRPELKRKIEFLKDQLTQ